MIVCKGEAMGLLDGFLNQLKDGQGDDNGLGSLISMAAKNPQIVAAVAGLLSTRDTSVGGSGGLGGLVGAFQKHGMGDMVSSWISSGPNPPITAAQLSQVLGSDTMAQFARKSGVPVGEAGSLLAGLLPTVIDKLTPDGNMPDTNSLEGTLGSLLAGFGGGNR
jgi:uncharacterized protein YidB (DUF937 family)